MAKVTICDVCRVETGKLIKSGWRVTFKKGMEKLSVDLCDDHKEWYKSHNYNTALDTLIGGKKGGE